MDVAGWLARWTTGRVIPFIRGVGTLGEIRTKSHDGQNANGGKRGRTENQCATFRHCIGENGINPPMAGIIVKPRSRSFTDMTGSMERDLKTFGDPVNGGLGVDPRRTGPAAGTGMYNSRSQIVARRFSAEEELDLDFFSGASHRPSSTGSGGNATCRPADWCGAKATGCRD